MNTTTLDMNAESLELEVLGRRFPLNWTDRKPERKARLRQLTPTTEQRQLKDVIGDRIWTTLEWSATTTPDDSSEQLVANYILSEEFQLNMTNPESWGWLSPIAPSMYAEEFQAAVAAFESHPATLSADVLNAAALPEPPATWVTAMEQGWIENVLEK